MARARYYDPSSTEPFQLSRTGLEQFLRCPRCFYQQRRLGLAQPRMVPLTLAVATDALLKNEFDGIRGTDATHPVWEEFGLKMNAYAHEDMDNWRNNFRGIRILHEKTNIEIFGAVDDVWQNAETKKLHIVDYKSTSKKGEPSIEGGGFADGYKRQMEIYQWIFGKAGHDISNTGYFLYVNGQKTNDFYFDDFEGRMIFETTLIQYDGKIDWVEQTIFDAKDCLHAENLPDSKDDCDNCRYFTQRNIIEKQYDD